jgi:hypothetical protein
MNILKLNCPFLGYFACENLRNLVLMKKDDQIVCHSCMSATVLSYMSPDKYHI